MQFCMLDEPDREDPLDCLRQECQIGNWSIGIHVFRIEILLFQTWTNNRSSQHALRFRPIIEILRKTVEKCFVWDGGTMHVYYDFILFSSQKNNIFRPLYFFELTTPPVIRNVEGFS